MPVANVQFLNKVMLITPRNTVPNHRDGIRCGSQIFHPPALGKKVYRTSFVIETKMPGRGFMIIMYVCKWRYQRHRCHILSLTSTFRSLTVR